MVLPDQKYGDTSLWKDVTGSGVPASWQSDYRNSSKKVETWTTGGGWLRKKTHHTLTTEIVGQKDYYTHYLKADYPIAIEIARGPTAGHSGVAQAGTIATPSTSGGSGPSINIQSGPGIYIQGSIESPVGGLVNLSSSGGSITSAGGAALFGASPAVVVAGDYQAVIEGDHGPLNVTAGGHITITAVSVDNQTSILVIDKLDATSGNVTVHAANGIEMLNSGSFISGNIVELSAGAGTIGSAALPVKVNSNILGTGGLAAMADGDINIVETVGDITLAQPQTWSGAAGAVVSASGNVHLTTVDGSILDGWIEQYQPNTSGLDDQMHLTGTGAQQAAEDAIRSEENATTQLYHGYWTTYRDAQRSTVAATLTIASINVQTDEITLSGPHGLALGDQVVFHKAAGGTQTNIQDDYEYYVIPVNDTTIKLASSRYDAAIAAAPAWVDLTSPGQTGAVTASGLSLLRYNYTTSPLSTPVADLDPRFQAIDAQYGAGQYDPDFIYKLSDAERQARIDARTFELGSLDYPISASLFAYLYPDANLPAGVVSNAPSGETPNVIGGNVTLTAGGSGGIGQVADVVHLDLSGGFAGLTAPQQQLLSAAGQEDVLGITYAMYEYRGSAGTVDLSTTDFSDGSLWARITPDFVTSEQSGPVTLAVGDVVLNQGEGYGLYRYKGPAGSTDLNAQNYLDAGHWQAITAVHTIGEGSVSLTAGQVVADRSQIDDLSLQVVDDVDLEATGSLQADAFGRVALQTTGQFNIDHVRTGGDVRLQAEGAIVDLQAAGTVAAISTLGNLSPSEQQLCGRRRRQSVANPDRPDQRTDRGRGRAAALASGGRRLHVWRRQPRHIRPAGLVGGRGRREDRRGRRRHAGRPGVGRRVGGPERRGRHPGRRGRQRRDDSEHRDG